MSPPFVSTLLLLILLLLLLLLLLMPCMRAGISRTTVRPSVSFCLSCTVPGICFVVFSSHICLIKYGRSFCIVRYCGIGVGLGNFSLIEHNNNTIDSALAVYHSVAVASVLD